MPRRGLRGAVFGSVLLLFSCCGRGGEERVGRAVGGKGRRCTSALDQQAKAPTKARMRRGSGEWMARLSGRSPPPSGPHHPQAQGRQQHAATRCTRPSSAPATCDATPLRPRPCPSSAWLRAALVCLRRDQRAPAGRPRRAHLGQQRVARVPGGRARPGTSQRSDLWVRCLALSGATLRGLRRHARRLPGWVVGGTVGEGGVGGRQGAPAGASLEWGRGARWGAIGGGRARVEAGVPPRRVQGHRSLRAGRVQRRARRARPAPPRCAQARAFLYPPRRPQGPLRPAQARAWTSWRTSCTHQDGPHRPAPGADGLEPRGPGRHGPAALPHVLPGDKAGGADVGRAWGKALGVGGEPQGRGGGARTLARRERSWVHGGARRCCSTVWPGVRHAFSQPRRCPAPSSPPLPRSSSWRTASCRARCTNAPPTSAWGALQHGIPSPS